MTRLTIWSSRVLMIVVFALCVGCAEPPPEIRRVFFITVDTLRADHLGTYGYARDTSPGIDRLAASGVVFERAIAQWPKTGSSFVSMFTGQYPQTTGLTHNAAIEIPNGYLTLPEFFKEIGFTTVAVTSNAVLTSRLGWDSGFDSFVESWDDERFSDDPQVYRKLIWGGRVNKLAFEAIDRHAGAQRLFAWIHYSDPHAPYILPEGWENPFLGDDLYRSGDARAVDLTATRGRAIGDERELRWYQAQYDANVAVADRSITELLAGLEQRGLLEDSLIVLTADHGESLGEHDLYFDHGPRPYNASSWVPLIFVGPPLAKGRRISTPVELVDLYATLRDLVAPGREVPGLEGASLLPFLLPEETSDEVAAASFRYAFSQAGGKYPLRHYRSVQDDRWKLVYHPEVQRGKRLQPAWWELYDLSSDRGETHDLFGQSSPDERRLQRVLSGWMKGNDWLRRSAETVEESSEETRRALKALGYIQ